MHGDLQNESSGWLFKSLLGGAGARCGGHTTCRTANTICAPETINLTAYQTSCLELWIVVFLYLWLCLMQHFGKMTVQ